MGRHQTISDEEIVRRARAAFLERGFDVRTRLLSAAIGLSWPAIVLRFGSKWELFRRAIVEPMRRLEATDGVGHADDLRELLERARSSLAERWLLQLHCRLAAASPARDTAADRWTQRLAALLGAQAGSGAVRSDVPPRELAKYVTAMLLGHAAQGFTRRYATDADEAFIDGVISMLRPQARSRPAAPRADSVDA